MSISTLTLLSVADALALASIAATIQRAGLLSTPIPEIDEAVSA